MLFHVRMDVTLPVELDPQTRSELLGREKAYSQELQRRGKWPHIWRVVGHYSNVSIFDVESNAQLHDLLTGLPLYPFMTMKVTALCRHPSSTHDDDR